MIVFTHAKYLFKPPPKLSSIIINQNTPRHIMTCIRNISICVHAMCSNILAKIFRGENLYLVTI